MQISFFPVNQPGMLPQSINVNFGEFGFERDVQMSGKSNVFALFWTQNYHMNEFYIAIDDAAKCNNFEIYLNTLVEINRIENGEFFSCVSL